MIDKAFKEFLLADWRKFLDTVICQHPTEELVVRYHASVEYPLRHTDAAYLQCKSCGDRWIKEGTEEWHELESCKEA